MLSIRQFLASVAPDLSNDRVPVLALAHCLDLGLEARHLGVQVLHRDSNRGHPVAGGAVFSLDPLVGLPLRQMGGAMRHSRQLRIQL